MAADRSRQQGRFPTTRWSLVGRAGHDMGELRREALGELLISYLPALKAHLVYGKGLSTDRSDDLLQEFVAGKILEKDLIARAEQGLGKFRTFLLTALDRFLMNRIRDEKAKKRSPEGGAVVAMGSRVDVARAEQGPSRAFETAWARGVVCEAVERMKAECERGGRPDVWGVFACRVVGPTLQGTPPVVYAELVRRFGLQSPSQASNVLMTGKRMYARALRSVVGEYAEDRREIEAEIEELREILAG